MCTEKNVLVRFKSQSFKHITVFDLFKIHSEHFCHRRSCHVRSLFRHTHLMKILPGRLTVWQIDVGYNINNSSVGFFRQAALQIFQSQHAPHPPKSAPSYSLSIHTGSYIFRVPMILCMEQEHLLHIQLPMN